MREKINSSEVEKNEITNIFDVIKLIGLFCQFLKKMFPNRFSVNFERINEFLSLFTEMA